MKCPNCGASRMRIANEGSDLFPRVQGYYCLNCDYHLDFDEIGEEEPPKK